MYRLYIERGVCSICHLRYTEDGRDNAINHRRLTGLPELTHFPPTLDRLYILSFSLYTSYHTPDMSRPTRAAKLKAGVNISAASGSADADDVDDHADEMEREVDESPAKRAKGKGKGKATGQKSTKRTTWEPIRKPPLCKEWKDIPDWKGREDSPLMGLPVEVLDKIFCVRPELNVRLFPVDTWTELWRAAANSQVRDYLALAGTCTFFRNHMTDDFWEVSLQLIESIDETYPDTAGRMSCRAAGIQPRQVRSLMGLWRA